MDAVVVLLLAEGNHISPVRSVSSEMALVAEGNQIRQGVLPLPKVFVVNVQWCCRALPTILALMVIPFQHLRFQLPSPAALIGNNRLTIQVVRVQHPRTTKAEPALRVSHHRQPPLTRSLSHLRRPCSRYLRSHTRKTATTAIVVALAEM